MRAPKFSLKKRFTPGMFALFVLVPLLTWVITSAYFVHKERRCATIYAGTNVTAITGCLSQVIQLPGETPYLATVSDKGLLQNQPFFNVSENGDKVLIFLASKRAILLRPSTGKIIDITSIQSVPTFTTPSQ